MRMLRVKVERDAYYHVTSRCALQEYLMGAKAKDMFVKMMRRAERFSGVHILTYCVMDNHFHILVKVPRRRDISEATLKERITILYGTEKADSIFARWKAFANAGDDESVQREQNAFRKRMYDLSEFGKHLSSVSPFGIARTTSGKSAMAQTQRLGQYREQCGRVAFIAFL